MSEHALLLGSAVLAALSGLLAWIADAGHPPSGRPGRGRAADAAIHAGSVVAVVAVAALVDPATRGWGGGFAAGGGAALLAWVLARRAPDGDATAPSACLALGVVVPALVLLVLRAHAADALVGAAAAWCAAALIINRVDGSDDASARMLAAAAIFAAAVAAAAALGVQRDLQRPENARWAAAAVALAAAVPFFSFVRAVLVRLTEGRGTGAVLAFLVAAVGLIGAAAILGQALRFDRLAWVTAVGVGAAAVGWALIAEIGAAPLALIAALAGSTAGFYLEAGYGVALAAAVGVLAAPAARFSLGLTRALAFGAAFAFYRVVASRFESAMTGPPLSDPFVLFTLVAGALAPAAAAARSADADRADAAASPAQSFAAGIATLAGLASILAVAVLLWGGRAAVGLTIGAAVSLTATGHVRPASRADGADRGGSDAPGASASILAAVLLAALTAQWTGPLAAIAPQTRADKILVVAIAAGAAVVAIAIADAAGRFRRRPPSVAAPEAGA